MCTATCNSTKDQRSLVSAMLAIVCCCCRCALQPFLQVLQRVLRSSMAQHNTEPGNPTLGAVQLSGVLHCDERIAFQEIAHQLCRFARSCRKHNLEKHNGTCCSLTCLDGVPAPRAGVALGGASCSTACLSSSSGGSKTAAPYFCMCTVCDSNLHSCCSLHPR